MLKLYLLGSPRIELGGEPAQVNTRKEIALLAYLAMSGESQTRDTLAALFWPESRQARTALRQTLWALRKTLGEEWLEIKRESLDLKRNEGLWLDVAQFERLLTTCQTHDHPANDVCLDCADLLSEAVELYRGDFLTGFSLLNSPGFDDWQSFQTERLREQMSAILERLVVYHSARRQFESAINYARRWLALDPLQEQAHCYLIKLYAWTGQRANALCQYQECAQILQKELGISPQEQARQLYQAIQESREPAPPPRPLPAHLHNLPKQPTPFVGRQEELAEIDHLLRDPACRLLTLLGPGGIGKTRLALQAAEQEVETFSHGVYFVPLSPLSSADFIVPTIASALKFSFHGQSDPQEQLLDFLRRKEVLLLLDSFEHLLEGVALLTAILTDTPQVKFLITSRERLSLRWEQLLDVEGLRFPKNGKRDGMKDYSAIQLFSQLAHRSYPKFPFSKEKPHVIRICQLVQGIPLAIELASAQVRDRSCEQIAKQIEHRLNLLSTTLRDMPVRHRSLEAAFDHSWELLTDEERRVFSKLSVFRGGFQAKAAERVTGALPALLDGLVAKSLLRQSPSGRFEMLDALRQYGVEKLAQTPTERVLAQDRHCVHFAGFLQQQEYLFEGAIRSQNVQAINEEIENVRLAWDWAVEQAQIERIEQCLKSLYYFYMTRSWFHQGKDDFGKAIVRLREVIEASNPAYRVVWKLLARQGVFLEHLCHYDEAIQFVQSSLEAFRILDDRQEITFSLICLARIIAIQGELSKAQTLLEEAIALAPKSHKLEADGLCNLGIVFARQGNFDQAKMFFERALGIYYETDNQKGQGNTLNNLGNITRHQCDYHKAVSYHEQSISIYNELNDHWGEALALGNLGIAFHFLEDYARSQACYEQSLCINQEIGHRQGEASAYNNLGLLFAKCGEYEKAKEFYARTLCICHEIENLAGKANALANLGLLLTKYGDYVGAIDHHEQALCIQRGIGSMQSVFDTLDNLGFVYHYLGNDKAATRYAQESYQIAVDLKYLRGQGDALTCLGHAQMCLGQLSEAALTYRQALDLWRELGEHSLSQESLAGLVCVFLAQGRHRQALDRAIEILNYLKDGSLDGTRQPFWIRLVCYRVLHANKDARAREILATAHSLLQEQAAKIGDNDMRRSFLENVAAHREIQQEFLG